jgi:hypothetical protein
MIIIMILILTKFLIKIVIKIQVIVLEDQKKNPIIEDPKSSTASSKEIMDITSILKEKNQNKNSIEFIN